MRSRGGEQRGVILGCRGGGGPCGSGMQPGPAGLGAPFLPVSAPKLLPGGGSRCASFGGGWERDGDVRDQTPALLPLLRAGTGFFLYIILIFAFYLIYFLFVYFVLVLLSALSPPSSVGLFCSGLGATAPCPPRGKTFLPCP